MSISNIWGREPLWDKAAEVVNALSVRLQMDLWDSPATALCAYGCYGDEILSSVVPFISDKDIADRLVVAVGILKANDQSHNIGMEAMVPLAETVARTLSDAIRNTPQLADRVVTVFDYLSQSGKNLMNARASSQVVQPVLGCVL